jgi:hypothetical protein
MLNKPKSYFNLELGSRETQVTRVYERPGLWMSELERSQLVSDLRTIVATLQVASLDYGVIQGTPEALDNTIITIAYDGPTGRPVAFNALSFMSCTLRGENQTVVHLGLVVIDPTYRAKGLSWVLYGLTTFLLFMKNRFRPIWITNVTQVPAIIGTVSDGFSQVFPNPLKPTRRSFDHLVLAREIMAKYRHVFGVGPEAEFDEENFVIRNAYTGGSDNLKKTFEQAAKHRLSVVNDFAHAKLDYERGDDILQIGRMDVSSYYRYALHQVPHGSKLTLLFRVLFAIFEFSVVPVIQWFSPSRAMGHLRPRTGWFL